ncbi:MAG: transporter ATP-binding protein [Firmicutes bacterium]|nr:transporter ATP-binding protein [Bacillota bacterium]
MNTSLNKTCKLRTDRIFKNYEGMPILDNVSIELYENEFVSVLGPSGCGKSTLFNIISGLDTPESGTYYIDGEESAGKLGKVSYMHQKDLLLPWKRIIDNLAMPLVIKGTPKKEAREEAAKYLGTFGLEGFGDKYPNQLSGGMRQRAALLRAYLFSRNIMLLDEPFGALDAITRSKIHYWLLNVVKKLNTSILFITHDIEEAILLSDRIYVLSERPARVKDEIKVEFEGGRNKDIITSPEFNQIKKRIMDNL